MRQFCLRLRVAHRPEDAGKERGVGVPARRRFCDLQRRDRPANRLIPTSRLSGGASLGSEPVPRGNSIKKRLRDDRAYLG